MFTWKIILFKLIFDLHLYRIKGIFKSISILKTVLSFFSMQRELE